MALVSPGVEVQVIDESFYTPAEPGTVPMIFVASAENKANGSGTGIAQGTLQANAGKPYLITSQRELVETFGDPVFYTDNNNNPIHAGELNEYGLQAAYSLLGVNNRAWVVRADLDLSKLVPQANAPANNPADGTNWFDTQISRFGINEWNGNPVTTTGGQTFTVQTDRIVITDVTKVTGTEDFPGAPKASVGKVGQYAIVAVSNLNKIWYKNSNGVWVEVGSESWKASHPTVRGTASNPAITPNQSFSLSGTTITAPAAVLPATTVTLQDVADAINTALQAGGVYSAAVVDGSLEIYSTGADVIIADVDGLGAEVGMPDATYAAPAIQLSAHTDVPQWKVADDDKPTGSVWIKTTEPNLGARWRIKRWNDETLLWEAVEAPLFSGPEKALYELDRAGGGINLAQGETFVKFNDSEATDPEATFKIYARKTTGATTIIGSVKTTDNVTPGTHSIDMAESDIGKEAIQATKTISFTTTGASSDADVVAGAINAAGFEHIEASVDSQDRLVIEHAQGGEIRIEDTNGILNEMGFVVYEDQYTGTPNLYAAPAGRTLTWVASNWIPMTYVAAEDPPQSLTAQGELWYSSIVDEVDMMIHNGNTWVGYHNYSTAYQDCDPNGPIVAASQPTTQSDGTGLVDGDLWIDTSDLENFPTIYRYNGLLLRWILLDPTDQTTEDGILFADARYNTSGINSDEAGAIQDLLTSNYLDFDAPDPALYPKGMLLWNLRRSGFNVKRFERNYVDVNDDNIRYNSTESDNGLNPTSGDAMADYYPHRWVTDSGNQEDGSGSFGRIAQRKSVVQALQAMVNSNQDIRDDEARLFNLMACPGYPELIGEMISLNYDRRLSAFIVGDSPARLTPDATSLNEWGANIRLAVEDNDRGLVSFDEYMGVYYPWGYTSDNAGNNVVVPPSHMALRVIALNDQVAYPWFAPAGTRRGGVTNATSTGYVNNEGEFVSIALNVGQRDTLYQNSVNPITFLTGSGLVVFGQKTRGRNASALDRINVARLVIYMRSQLEKLAKPYLFEPNDKITRDEIKAAAESLCLELVGLRALYDFLVVCDESNNTPARIDRNELWLDIAIEPVKAIEFIYIPLRLKNTGEISGLQ